MPSKRRPRTRRQLLRISGTALMGTVLAGCAGLMDDEGETTKNTQTTTSEKKGSGELTLQKVGQLQPSGNAPPSGGYSEVSIREDGKYAILGSKWGISGSYLINLDDPDNPNQVHHLGNPNSAPNLDVKFDFRDGLYYRAIERHHPGNFEVVDYGYDVGTPSNPTVVGTASDGKSHNVTPHPTKPVLYTVNYRLETSGFDVYDVRDPTNPNKISEHGPRGAGHDVTVDPEREVLCCFYQSGEFIGIVIYDVSEPRKPSEIGRFDYQRRKSYSTANVGEEAFGSAHHGHFDPRRELLIVGDERPQGIPGGKHVFDVGWKDGSLSNPIPVGFTVSPNAQRMAEDDFAKRFDWTGHHFSIVPWSERTFIVSADWHEGVMVYDITDPTNPNPVDRYPTDDGMNSLTPNDKVAQFGEAPMAWTARYDANRELVVVSDTFTGLYTFKLATRK
ncbi:LVIVD repeat-containing protein [Haladaptatus cibarius]|uniref:LVIVD repeat-containing protein n=1 Tax=Haladaptatus cibarius TaxID=453847 RepID=UPI001E35E05A|nr:hypothetical protein [Haladaptatus cibarius]